MTRRKQRAIMRANGILRPLQTQRIARRAGVPVDVLCAFLMTESGGGHNIYGHDGHSTTCPRPMARPAGVDLPVTEANYEVYLGERDAFKDDPDVGYRRQGVGPMQLTWHTYQDEADAIGGCWKPYANTLTGARILRRHYDNTSAGLPERQRWHQVAVAYNDESYADAMDGRIQLWRTRLAG